MNITLEQVRDEWRACYGADRLAELYDRPHTPLEVLTRNDGPWADVPAKDRLWTAMHNGVLPDRTLRIFAADCAERALLRERSAGREPDARSWRAVEVARMYVSGTATRAELRAAARAAHIARARATPRDAVWAATAAVATVDAAERFSAHDAGWVAEAAARDTGPTETAEAAEREWQVARLIELVREGSSRA